MNIHTGADIGDELTELYGPDWWKHAQVSDRVSHTYEDRWADGYQFGDIFGSIGDWLGDVGDDISFLTANEENKRRMVDEFLGIDKATKGLTDGNANSGANSGKNIGASGDLGSFASNGRDSDVYGSDDKTGFDQASWALEEQWKMDEAERSFNSAEAQKQRDWEEMMSNTAIQRAVQDIRAAGLNPWLALNGGSLGAASTPSGASASASSGSSKVPVNYTLKLITSLLGSASKLLSALFG